MTNTHSSWSMLRTRRAALTHATRSRARLGPFLGAKGPGCAPFIRRTGSWRSNDNPQNAGKSNQLKASRMRGGRLLRACLVALAFFAAATGMRPAFAQANFDRPGGDYLSSAVPSGDPADCALLCERDRRCRAWRPAGRLASATTNAGRGPMPGRDMPGKTLTA